MEMEWRRGETKKIAEFDNRKEQRWVVVLEIEVFLAMNKGKFKW